MSYARSRPDYDVAEISTEAEKSRTSKCARLIGHLSSLNVQGPNSQTGVEVMEVKFALAPCESNARTLPE
jgi:hypothetical protein